MLLGDHFDCINPRRIKRQVLLNTGDCLIRFFVRPNGVFRFRSADGNAVVRTITLVRTIAVVLGPNQQRHVRIVAWQVVNRRISLLLQSKCPRRFGHYSSGDRYTHPALSRRNRDGMVRPRNSDLFAFARLSVHCAPRRTSYSFDPPSTGILAPVIQRAFSEAKNATTPADSLECLHPESELAACFSSSEVRHIRVDHTRRDRVYANALRPKNGSPVLDQGL